MQTEAEVNSESPTNAPHRSSAEVVHDLEQKRARRATLSARLGAIDQELDGIRDQQARSLADGGEFKGAQKIATLTNEQDAIQRALEVIAGDIRPLEAERARARVAETKIVDTTARAAAIEAVDSVEALIRTVAVRDIFPAMERAKIAVDEARSAEAGYDVSVKAAGGKVNDFKDYGSGIMGQRGKLQHVLNVLQSFVDGRSPVAELEQAATSGEVSLALR